MAVRRKCTKQPVEHGLISIIPCILGDTCPIRVIKKESRMSATRRTRRQVHEQQQPNNPTTQQQINNNTTQQSTTK